ncbi:lipase [Solihabitans fulvus]|uniref:Lipase n=1 Tax=Solihabitans fulvus TaxID=1892852 RepID=A0A5B2XJY9_9PSEU|nr:lipase [Solihabitans fulvus]
MDNRSNRRVLLRAGLALAAALAVAVPATAAASTTAQPIQIALPAPTGGHQVGTGSLHLVDQTRADPWRQDRRRELMVTISYPSRHMDSAPRADWLTPGIGSVVQALAAAAPLNVPSGAVDWTATKRWASQDTPVDRRHGPWPVVLFSPGFGVPRELDTLLTDDLASRGYVVVSMSHTYESSGVEFPGGRVETALVADNKPETMKTAIDVRVADARFVLDELTRLNAGANPDAEHRQLPPGLRGALDLSRVGMFGHSYGGYTSGETMYQDGRIAAGVNLDGSMAYGFGTDGSPYLPGEVTKHGLDRPFMLMGSTYTDPTTGQKVQHSHLPDGGDRSWADFWGNQRGWKRDFTLTQGAHHSYTDNQAVLPQLGSLIPQAVREVFIGTVDPARSLAAQHEYLASFFDRFLRGCDNHLLDGPSPSYPELTFQG